MPKQSTAYIYGLDLIRFVSALMVCVFHLSWQSPQSAWAMPVGWVGVQIFFVISGVVIANSASAATPMGFLKGRFLRLYPVAWIAACVNTVFLTLVPITAFHAFGLHVNTDAGAIVHSLILLWGPFLTSAYWTLPIELAFYAIIFVSLFFGGVRHFQRIARSLVFFSAPYIVLYSLHQQGVIAAPWLDLGYGLKNAMLFRHGIFFAIGIYLWWLSTNKPMALLDKAALCIAVIASGFEIHCRSVDIVFVFARPTNVWILSAFAIGVFLLAVGAIAVSVFKAAQFQPQAWGRKVIRMMGLITYPLYLMHEAVGGYFLHLGRESGMGMPGAIGIAVMMAVLFAYVVAAKIEPAVRWVFGVVIDRVMPLARA